MTALTRFADLQLEPALQNRYREFLTVDNETDVATFHMDINS